MLRSSRKCTPRSRLINSPSVNDLTNTDEKGGSIRKSSESVNKTLLTPCRRVGLKRKSSDLKKQHLFKHLDNSNSEADEVITKQHSVNRDRSDYLSGNQGNSPLNIISSTNTFELKRNNNTTCITNDDCNHITVAMLEEIANDIRRKKDRLKHVQLSKVYEKKHDLQMLKEITEKWKQGCQNALLELKDIVFEKGFGLSMHQLLSQFQIPHELIHFNEESDDFE